MYVKNISLWWKIIICLDKRERVVIIKGLFSNSFFMENRIIAVVRHAPYESLHDIGEHGKVSAKRKWEELLQTMGIRDNVASTLLVSSSAPRAIQTTEAIREGLGLTQDHPIHSSEHLFDDNTHLGDLTQAIAFIKQLPDSLFLVVVTHLDFVWPVAKELGLKTEAPWRPNYLSWAVFTKE